MFEISCAAFEMQHTINKAFGDNGEKSYMHNLHLDFKKELDKELPNNNKLDVMLSLMQDLAESYQKTPNFEKGCEHETNL